MQNQKYTHIKTGKIVEVIGEHKEPYFLDRVKKGTHVYKVVQEVETGEKFLAFETELKPV